VRARLEARAERERDRRLPSLPRVLELQNGRSEEGSSGQKGVTMIEIIAFAERHPWWMLVYLLALSGIVRVSFGGKSS
jgi:hypothetical protein